VIYELEYKRGRRALVADEIGLSLDTGDFAILESEEGEDVGKVVWKGIVELAKEDLPETARLLRRAEIGEVNGQAARERREADALDVFGQNIKNHELPMDPLEVDFPGGDSVPITFYFFAPHRIDFRELVRSLARIYRTRIVLRQVSPRQRAQWAGGCGSCGRSFCCSAFMRSMPQCLRKQPRLRSCRTVRPSLSAGAAS